MHASPYHGSPTRVTRKIISEEEFEVKHKNLHADIEHQAPAVENSSDLSNEIPLEQGLKQGQYALNTVMTNQGHSDVVTGQFTERRTRDNTYQVFIHNTLPEARKDYLFGQVLEQEYKHENTLKENKEILKQYQKSPIDKESLENFLKEKLPNIDAKACADKLYNAYTKAYIEFAEHLCHAFHHTMGLNQTIYITANEKDSLIPAALFVACQSMAGTVKIIRFKLKTHTKNSFPMPKMKLKCPHLNHGRGGA